MLSHKKGFTFLETIVSVSIVTVALLVVAAVFTGAISAGSKNTDLESGVLIAQSTLNRTIYDVLNLTPPVTLVQKGIYFNSAVPTLLASSNVTLNSQVYSYNVTCQMVYDPAPPPATNHLALFSIDVFWGLDPTGVRQGQGVTRTSLSRLVNEQSNQ